MTELSEEKLVAHVFALNEYADLDEIRDLYQQAYQRLEQARPGPIHAAIHLSFGMKLRQSDSPLALLCLERAGKAIAKDGPVEMKPVWHEQMAYVLIGRMGQDPSTLEDAISHAEKAEDADPTFNRQLATLYGLRQAGDRHENWVRQTSYARAALQEIDPTLDPQSWAHMNHELAEALLHEPDGDFLAQVNESLQTHLATLEVLGANRGDTWVDTQLSLFHLYAHCMQGDASENLQKARACAQGALDACNEHTLVDRRRMAIQSLAQILVHPASNPQQADFEHAMKQLDKAYALLDPVKNSQAMADLDRSYALMLLTLVQKGQHQHIGKLCKRVTRAVDCLGGALPERVLVLEAIAADGLVAVNQFEDAAARLHRGLTLGHLILKRSQSTQGRLESVHDLHNSAGLLAYCYIKSGHAEAAIDALELGKGLFWKRKEQPSTLALWRDCIPSDGAALFACFTGPECYVIAATRSLTRVVELPELNRQQFLELQCGNLDLARAEGWIATYITHRAFKEKLGPALKEIGEALYHRLWAPVLQTLGSMGVSAQSELIWFDDAGSSVFPMQVVWHQEAGQPRWLVDDYALRFAPSLDSLQQGEGAECNPSEALAISDPGLDVESEELEVRGLRSYLEERNPVISLTVLEGKQATSKALLAGMPSAAVLHLSCHGNFDTEDPWLSGFSLANGERMSLAQCLDGLAQGGPEIVVLSACESGLTKFTAHVNESLGFPAAFLSAGSRAVLASHWKVPDVASGLLVGRFYEQLAGSQSAAHALRLAQRWLRDITIQELRSYLDSIKREGGPAAAVVAPWRTLLVGRGASEQPYRSPYYWAGFNLYGS